MARKSTRKPKNRYHHGDLRRALILEAVRTIQAEGVEALTLRAVALALGVSRTALYRHFADKAALLAAVGGEGFRTLRVALEAAQRPGGHEGFEAMGLAYVRFALANPSYYRVMFGNFVADESLDSQLSTEGALAFTLLVNAIVEEQRAGRIVADDPQQLAQFIWASLHGVAMLALDGQLAHAGTDLEALSRFVVAHLHSGVAVRQ